MEEKKIKVVVLDKNTLRLEEDGKKGDYIDLRELSSVDTSALEKAIAAKTDEVYKKKLEEQALLFKSTEEKELVQLRQELSLCL